MDFRAGIQTFDHRCSTRGESSNGIRRPGWGSGPAGTAPRCEHRRPPAEWDTPARAHGPGAAAFYAPVPLGQGPGRAGPGRSRARGAPRRRAAAATPGASRRHGAGVRRAPFANPGRRAGHGGPAPAGSAPRRRPPPNARPLLEGAGLEARRDEWVGSRPCAADGLPLIGATRSPRVFAAGGHGMWGITLGPVTGRLLAERVATGRETAEPAPFAPLR
ncbi:FAD-dependent oxidoreductase [Streptomyces verrucosisporus]|uniref:FAD-dependent oxidoreductase n=1 Tax=Streptomyces verrucosisporus TaxID=1695161 RepID=UPI002402BDBE|nr:FAD-dependent oxidoreductase [Streptomyces verrucosisporus]